MLPPAVESAVHLACRQYYVSLQVKSCAYFFSAFKLIPLVHDYLLVHGPWAATCVFIFFVRIPSLVTAFSAMGDRSMYLLSPEVCYTYVCFGFVNCIYSALLQSMDLIRIRKLHRNSPISLLVLRCVPSMENYVGFTGTRDVFSCWQHMAFHAIDVYHFDICNATDHYIHERFLRVHCAIILTLAYFSYL